MKHDIFAVGKWNGIEFSGKDLDGIISAFQDLGTNHVVPLKLGHQDKKPFDKGQPALGWVKGLINKAGKLVAEFEDLPPIVKKAFEKKLYRKVSIELDRDVTYKGKHYDYVLSGVALLGADIPAVNNLSDLGAYFSLVGSEKLSFDYQNGNLKGEDDMSTEALEKQIASLTSQFSKLQENQESLLKENQKLAEENTSLKKQVETFEREKKEAAEAEAKKIVGEKREVFTKYFDALVKDQKLTPGQRDGYLEMLGVNDDARVVTLDFEKVQSMVGIENKYDFNRKETAGKGEGKKDIDMNKPDASLFSLTQDYIDKNGGPEKVDFSRASEAVMRQNPELAQAWKDMSDPEAATR